MLFPDGGSDNWLLLLRALDHLVRNLDLRRPEGPQRCSLVVVVVVVVVVVSVLVVVVVLIVVAVVVVLVVVVVVVLNTC